MRDGGGGVRTEMVSDVFSDSVCAEYSEVFYGGCRGGASGQKW